jgi:hypothetical protein
MFTCLGEVLDDEDDGDDDDDDKSYRAVDIAGLERHRNEPVVVVACWG